MPLAPGRRNDHRLAAAAAAVVGVVDAVMAGPNARRPLQLLKFRQSRWRRLFYQEPRHQSRRH